jgi:hypothetical protein
VNDFLEFEDESFNSGNLYTIRENIYTIHTLFSATQSDLHKDDIAQFRESVPLFPRFQSE